jgi:hypothetical protein
MSEVSGALPASLGAPASRSTPGSTFEEGLEWVVGRMLQSPHFMFRVELESAGQVAGTVVPLSGYSIATRLSYFLWQSSPDEALMAAAESGALDAPTGIATEVTRMMNAERFDMTLSSFHEQWLGWNAIVGTQKDVVTTPAWDSTLQYDFRRESELFVKSIFLEGGTFTDVLTSSHTFVNPGLAQFYGIAYPGTGTEFVKVDSLPHRYGVMTHPSIMATYAHRNQSAPVRRGEFVRKHLLCTEPEPPPMGVQIEIPEVAPGMTTRERFEAHRTEPSCRGCHVALDPLGVPFEHYDELGRWRDMDQGKPVDANGGLTYVASLGDVDDPTLAPVNGPLDFAQKLSVLPEAQQCMVYNWFRYAMGHVEEEADTCMVTLVMERFQGSLKMNELVTAIATSDGFRYRVDRAQP